MHHKQKGPHCGPFCLYLGHNQGGGAVLVIGEIVASVLAGSMVPRISVYLYRNRIPW